MIFAVFDPSPLNTMDKLQFLVLIIVNSRQCLQYNNYLIDASSSAKLIYVGQAKDILLKIYNRTAVAECFLSMLSSVRRCPSHGRCATKSAKHRQAYQDITTPNDISK